MPIVTAYIHHHKDNPEAYYLQGYDGSSYGGILIEKREIEFFVPSIEDRTKLCVEELNKEITKIQATAYKEITEVQEKIQKLLCLENKTDDNIPFQPAKLGIKMTVARSVLCPVHKLQKGNKQL